MRKRTTRRIITDLVRISIEHAFIGSKPVDEHADIEAELADANAELDKRLDEINAATTAVSGIVKITKQDADGDFSVAALAEQALELLDCGAIPVDRPRVAEVDVEAAEKKVIGTDWPKVFRDTYWRDTIDQKLVLRFLRDNDPIRTTPLANIIRESPEVGGDVINRMKFHGHIRVLLREASKAGLVKRNQDRTWSIANPRIVPDVPLIGPRSVLRILRADGPLTATELVNRFLRFLRLRNDPAEMRRATAIVLTVLSDLRKERFVACRAKKWRAVETPIKKLIRQTRTRRDSSGPIYYRPMTTSPVYAVLTPKKVVAGKVYTYDGHPKRWREIGGFDDQMKAALEKHFERVTTEAFATSGY